MRIFKIEIERFLGLRNIDIEISSETQLIAGPNNAGKSSILTAIDAFFSAKEINDFGWIYPQNSYYIEEGPRSLTRIKIFFTDLTNPEKETFKEALTQKGEFWSEIKISRLGIIRFVASKSANGEKIYDLLIENYDVIYVPAVRAGSTDITNNEIGKIFSTTKSILARTRRGKLNALQSEFQKKSKDLFQIFSQILDGGRESISKSLPQGTDISFEFPDAGILADLIFSRTKIKTRNGTSITLEQEGTGLQSLLSLGILDFFTQASKSSSILFLIEEPEAFLHPQFQRIVADYLGSISKSAQVISTTHSGVIIDSTDITTILRLHRDPKGLMLSWKSPIMGSAKEQGLLNRYCNLRNSELIFADKVIFCEGITDKLVLNSIIKKVTEKSPHHKNISIIDCDGDSIVNVAAVAKLYNVPYLAILDKDSCVANRDKLKKLCELIDSPLTANEYSLLDKIKAAPPASIKTAFQQRDQINSVTLKRNIFVLSGDIEASVAHSYERKYMLPAIGPDGMEHLSSTQVNGLEKIKTQEDYIKDMNTALGSKGWSNGKSNKNSTPKPHVLSGAIDIITASPRPESDVHALSKLLKTMFS